jgi:hypothetical protein
VAILNPGMTSFISGPLPLGGSAPPPVAGASPAGIQQAYNQNFNAAQGINQANYQNVMGGYQQAMGDQRTAQQNLAAGYTQLAGAAGGAAAASGAGLAQGYGNLAGGLAAQSRNSGNNLEQQYAQLRGQTLGFADRMNNGLTDFRRANAGIAQGYGQLAGQVQGDLGGMGRGLEGFARGAAETERDFGTFRRNMTDAYGTMTGRTEQGYRDLEGRVMGTLNSIGESERMDIEADYARSRGASRQSMTNRGLGNSTVLDSVQRGNEFDMRRSRVDLADRLAAQRAGAQQNIGLSGLRAVGDFRQNDLRSREGLGIYGADMRQSNDRTILGQQNAEAQARAGARSQLGLAGLGLPTGRRPGRTRAGERGGRDHGPVHGGPRVAGVAGPGAGGRAVDRLAGPTRAGGPRGA